ncbi:VCBS repeat-containing protein [Streptomyces sp. NPDC047072]|uniref:VCBS repeat-containing protein n=1 Tax=Streptomyces sp. NPDC047072 TaxID=3154809 RepID=UPI0033DA54B0
MARRRWGLAALVVAGLTVAGITPASAVHGGVPGDFNGDGYRDAVLPAPGANVSGKEAAGAVVVLYGSSSGLSASRRKTITQNTAGVPGAAEKWDAFGAATATADLNRDGYADLVVGTPDEDTPQGADVGLVTVLWGSANGLTGGTNLPSLGSGPRYGQDIAAVSTGRDSRTRLSIASRFAAVHFQGPFTRAGEVGGGYLDTNTGSVLSVTLGDFDQDGQPDPAVATVRDGDLTGGRIHTGLPLVQELRGNGLITAAGDINGDGFADLAVGDPDEPRQAGVDGEPGGRVLVWYGSASGIATDAEPVEITQNTAGVPGASEKHDAFGGALAVADLNRDGLADIVVGSPYENLAKNRAGHVTVIPGRASGALGTGAYTFSQDTPGVPGASEIDDFFGTTVSVGDVNKDGKPDLFVGASGENNFAGAVWVLPGGSTRPTATGSKMFTAAAVGLTQQNGTLLGGNGLLWVI